MKQLMTIAALLLCLVSNAQYSGQYGIIDNSPNTGGYIYWAYTYDGGNTYFQQKIVELDTSYFRILCLMPNYPAVNTNTALVGVDNNGNINRYNISSLPFKPSTYQPTLSLSGNNLSAGGNTITLPTSTTYTNSGTVAGGAGNVIFYLTSTKTSTGTALYSSMPTVIPIVNDASTNYTYAWTLSPDFKTLTVNVKSSPGLVVGLLTLLGVPVNVADGTAVRVTIN